MEQIPYVPGSPSKLATGNLSFSNSPVFVGIGSVGTLLQKEGEAAA